MKLRKELRWFSDEMEKVLQDNDYKGGWSYCSQFHLSSKLAHNYSTMLNLLEFMYDDGLSKEDRILVLNQIINTCTDVANFAMMIADNAVNEQFKIEEDSK